MTEKVNKETVVDSVVGSDKPSRTFADQRKAYKLDLEKRYGELRYWATIGVLIFFGIVSIIYIGLVVAAPAPADALLGVLQYFGTLLFGGLLGALFKRAIN